MFDRAKTTVAGAHRPHDHEGRRLAGITFADIGAAGIVANSLQAMIAD
jgi:hypothetical protein